MNAPPYRRGYYVCDYCGHVQPCTVPLGRFPETPCASCRQPLDTRTTFADVDDAGRYSQAVQNFQAEEDTP